MALSEADVVEGSIISRLTKIRPLEAVPGATRVGALRTAAKHTVGSQTQTPAQDAA